MASQVQVSDTNLRQRLAAILAADVAGFSRLMEQRRQAQTIFPDHKVFAGHQCPDMGAVRYLSQGVAYNAFFVAVYAGESPGDAVEVLARARDAYPRATILQMLAAYTLLWE